MGKITQQTICIYPKLGILSLIADKKRNLKRKSLITFMCLPTRLEIALKWKTSEGVSLGHWKVRLDFGFNEKAVTADMYCMLRASSSTFFATLSPF